MPLNRAIVQLPFAAGLDTKADPRALPAPSLERALNIQFDETGGIQLRKPFAAIGGSTPASPRKLVANGNELLLFTEDTLYSWDASAAAWVAKGTHLAIEMAEETVFAGTGDEVDCDRAELGGTIFYTWSCATASGVNRVWIAATDTVTGTVILPPTNPVGASNGSRPRLVALLTKVLLFWVDAVDDLICVALTPGSAAISTALPVAASPTYAHSYDVTAVIGADTAVLACQQEPTTSYTIATVTAALALATATKVRVATKIALSSAPGGNNLVQICRASGGNLQGDLIDISTFTDLAVNQALGTAAAFFTQIACAHRSVQDGGQYRCYVFWPDGESVSSNVTLKTTWVDTGGTVNGAGQQTLSRNLGCASRAFDHGGRVFFWAAYAMTSGVSFAGAAFRQTLQNGYFLYRDDGFLCAKATPQAAGGYPASEGRLPGVASVDGITYAWCGMVRRIVPLGASNNGSTGYAERSPRDITFAFDSNEARRCARMGGTLYIAAGELLQYDGTGLVEVGFHVYPARIAVTATTGAMDDGTYAWKFTYGYVNGAGERERSTDVTAATATLSGGAGTNGGLLNVDNLYVTHKTAIPSSGRAALIECWRTAKNPEEDAPFVKVTSDDPTLGAIPNNLIVNDPSGFGITTGGGLGGEFLDELVDAAAILREPNPENGSVLEFVSPPAARILLATPDRLFLAGIADDPNEVWYSRTRNAGEVASFNDTLTFTVPAIGGDITGLGYFNETLVVFCEHAVFVMPGTGFTNGEAGQNYGPAHVSTTDVGALSHESIALAPFGLIFKTAKGWYALDGGWNVKYIGAKVAAHDAEPVLAAHVVHAQHQIRFVTSGRVLVFDYNVGEWAEWSLNDGLDATIWKGTHAHLSASLGPLLEQATYDLADYDYDVETAFVKGEDLQGACVVRRIQPLGSWESQHQIRMRVARDYERDDTGAWDYYDDRTWTPNTSIVGNKLQFAHGPSRPKCSATKVRLTSIRGTTTNSDGLPVPIGGALAKLTGIAFAVGIRPTLNPRVGIAQKV